MHNVFVHDPDKAAFFMHKIALYMFTYSAFVHERCAKNEWRILGGLGRFLG